MIGVAGRPGTQGRVAVQVPQEQAGEPGRVDHADGAVGPPAGGPFCPSIQVPTDGR